MTKSIDQLRRDAKALKKAHDALDKYALVRVNNHQPRGDGTPLTHADFLHVIAREQGFASWPHLKFAAETHGMDRAAKQQRLGQALYNGQAWMVERLLAETPDLAAGHLGLLCGLYEADAVEERLWSHPSEATQDFGVAPPLFHLARSKLHLSRPEAGDAALRIAGMLVERGADVNGSIPVAPGNDHPLSVLYFALGHAGNVPLAEWLLEQGADPNDGESLYHATELGHLEGVRVLLKHGADPKGTNALLRAMDFDNLEMVRMLLDHGANADEFDGTHVGGEAPWVYPALHQAGRRMCGAEMVAVLLGAGADPSRVHEGVTAYSMARVFGNATVARMLEERGASTALSREETLLAGAADGVESVGAFVDPDRLPPAYQNLIRQVLHLPPEGARVAHLRRLVALGVPFDTPDTEGLTPVQVAGWEGLSEVMAYLLRLSPDLGHINGYGGTLLSTILHGSENNPNGDGRDYAGCLVLALEQGVAIPRRAPELAGVAELAEILRDWAERFPGQVVEGGPI